MEPHLVSLLLKEKGSSVTGGAHLCGCLLFPTETQRHDSPESPPRRAENGYETPQLNPCWNIRASVPPPPPPPPPPPTARLSNSTRPSSTSTADFSKASADAGGMHYGCIPGPSAGATPGRQFWLFIRFTPGERLPALQPR